MICAIVLSAGRSRRMGRQKLLLPIENRPLICCVVDQVLASSVDQVLVVVGMKGNEIATTLADRAVRLVINPATDSEMIDSVRCGLAALPGQCEAALVVLGDQPCVGPELIDRLIQTSRQDGRGIAVPTFKGRRGHPLLFSTRYRDEILHRYGDTGLRGLMQAHPEDVVEVETAIPGVLDDIDVPEDYDRITSPGGED